jgi:hypothetical protein
MMKYPIQSIRFLSLLIKFKRKYEKFKESCLVKSQKEVINSDKYYKTLYFQTAEKFVELNNLKKIAKKFLSEGTYMCTFQPLNKISAFDFLRLCTGLMIPAYEFEFLKDSLIDGFSDKIILDSVNLIKNKVVKTRKGRIFKTSNLVIATPPHISENLLGLKKMKTPVNSYAIHVNGDLMNKSGQFELFPSGSDVIFIRKQEDESFIFYSKIKNIDLKKYFKNPKVIKIKEWKPAFHMGGNVLWDSDFGKNIYLIGDHNLIGLETSFITGLYAANKVISNSQK